MTHATPEASARRSGRRRGPQRDPRHDVLFEPVTIGPKTLPNRFFQTPHCTGFGTDKPFSQASHRGLKAEGGWGAVCTEYAPVSEDSDDKPHNAARVWNLDDMRNLALLCEAAHTHGALAGIELHHAGAHAAAQESRWPVVAPSQLATTVWVTGGAPKEMELSDIRRIRGDWVRAARQAADVGFDIVYVYGGHAFLLLQFLSPFYNRRTDAYGGSFENRARLWLEILEEVGEALAGRCAIAVRMSVDALGPYGVDLSEGLEFIARADSLVDLWDITAGGLAGLTRIDAGPSRFFKEGHQHAHTAQVRQATKKPIVNVGRFTSPDVMADLVRSGACDLIGAARPSIADPFLPEKIREGRYDDIRECIGCNFCYSRANWGLHLSCTQNATAGEEYRRGWHPEQFEPATNADRDVLIVGAGPAGLECAIVLGKRGMRRVHVVDADSAPGGNVRWVSQLPGLAEWRRLIDWRVGQLAKLRNVELHCNARMSADDVLDYGAEIVIAATGSRWAPDGLNGHTPAQIAGADARLPHILTPEQIMVEGKAILGERVLVWDCDGYHIAAGLAERLATAGHAVDLRTCHADVAELCNQTLEGIRIRKRLHELGVSMHRGFVLEEIAPDYALGRDEFDEPVRLEVDAVVLVTQRVSNLELYQHLRAADLSSHGIEAVYRIGDCVAPRLLGDAIFDGHRLAREIDAGNPELPLPYLRERVIA